MEGEQILSVVTSNGPAPVLSEDSVHQYPVMYSAPGVVNKRNGPWDGYLCANDEHFWLTSSETEEAALEAQQKACIEFYDVDSNTPQYQYHSHSTADEVSSYLGAQVQEKPDSAAVPDTFGLNLRQLFVKVLTPSDAGKLNRLVIPKRYAIKHFPLLSKDGGASEDADVVFYDMSMKLWKFRYCYWGSSQSYVFTRGWSGFLKEKFLQPKDTIIFSAYDGSDEDGKQVYVIDVAYDNDAGAPLIPDINDNSGDAFPIEYVPMLPAAGGEENGRTDAHDGVEEQKGVKLFGVNIIPGA